MTFLIRTFCFTLPGSYQENAAAAGRLFQNARSIVAGCGRQRGLT